MHLVGIYIKTRVGELVEQDGYENGGQPRGGGWRKVRNITFSDVDVTKAINAIIINQNEENNKSFSGTSKMEVEDIVFERFTGTLASTSSHISIACSKVHPCYDILFSELGVRTSSGSSLRGKMHKCEGKRHSWTVRLLVYRENIRYSPDTSASR